MRIGNLTLGVINTSNRPTRFGVIRRESPAGNQIAIGHRIILLRDAAKLTTSRTLAANNTESGGSIAGVNHTKGKVSYAHWVDFMTKFGTAYRGDCALGNPTSITALKLMSITDGENLSLGSWSIRSNCLPLRWLACQISRNVQPSLWLTS